MSKSKIRYLFDGIRPSLDGATGLNPYNRSLSSRSCSLTSKQRTQTSKQRTQTSKQRTHKFLALLSPIIALHLSRTLYKSALFMQNKPNFRKSQMNVSIFSKMAYEYKHDWTLGENKPNSNPNKPNQTQSRRFGLA